MPERDNFRHTPVKPGDLYINLGSFGPIGVEAHKHASCSTCGAGREVCWDQVDLQTVIVIDKTQTEIKNH